MIFVRQVASRLESTESLSLAERRVFRGDGETAYRFVNSIIRKERLFLIAIKVEPRNICVLKFPFRGSLGRYFFAWNERRKNKNIDKQTEEL